MPWVNYALIGANTIVYVLTSISVSVDGSSWGEELKARFVIDPRGLELAQFFTYQFLHGDIWHLLGNMLFLWVFGNSVNSKMGQAAYLMFYLSCGVFAGVGFAITSTQPCLGASGAIAGVTTAYLVLFPRANITVLYWIWFYLGTMQIQSLVLIVAKIILWDNIVSPRLAGEAQFTHVAYSAHLAGYAFGFVWCSLMLLVRAVPRDQYDLVALVRRAYQRHQFRHAMANPDAAARAQYGRVARPIAQIESAEDTAAEPMGAVQRLRLEISELLSIRNYQDAAAKYEELVALDSTQCLAQRQMLDIANQLTAMNRYPQAAAAYEKYLKAYPSDGDAHQIKLMLGIIYAKYLRQYEAARKYLQDCVGRLTNPDLLAQARHWLAVTESGGE